MKSKKFRLLGLYLVVSLVAIGVLVLSVGRPRPAAASAPLGQSADGLWREVRPTDFETQGQRDIVPQAYRTLAADSAALRARLAQAPLETAPDAQASAAVITLPLPDGTFERFAVLEAPIMEPQLAAKFAEIKTYTARGLDDPTASGRLDWTMFGFHAMIFSQRGVFFVDPFSRNDTTHYISYFESDFVSNKGFIEGGVFQVPGQERVSLPAGVNATSGPQLRTYRLALATTGEYTIYHGGTVAAGMSAVVTSVNRVTGVYEREVAVRLSLIANNDLLIYTNPATDPYTNDDGFTMLAENQTNIDAVIGSANYDVGHVFSTGGGGVAYLGVPCQNGWKARGVTGSPAPVGDPYDIDYVAHEMGHQFGANHTFNSVSGACGGGNRNGPTAYEPGSGSTIMSYAGICGADDLQPHSDPQFHTISFDEIAAYTQSGTGNLCAQITNTGNHAPVVQVGVGGFTIPKGTPFSLTGSATDADGDALTYSWEEFDLGPAGSPNSPSGNAPIFRSFPPVDSPTRVFPRLDDLVNNTHTIGELLPSYARTLTFRLTARDNHFAPSAGGVAYAVIQFSVSGTAGPFLVTAPNTAVVWTAGSTQTVTWNVANTHLAPVNCSNVQILLSTDGGYTYPITLTNGVDNDGSQAITVPYIATNQARIKVACVNNIFFDISNVNFTIMLAAPAAFSKTSPANGALGVEPNPTLAWQAADGATSYDYCYDTSDDANCDNIWLSAGANTSVSLSGLSDQVTYYWQVRAHNSAGDTPANAGIWWQFTTGVPASAALALAKSVSPTTTLQAGDLLTYTLTLTNSGTTTATATLTDTFAAALLDPSCNETPGDLLAHTAIAPGGQAVYTCQANIDPALGVVITATADQTVVTAGSGVTYTITVSNPNPTVTLTNVTVSGAALAGCEPPLGMPFDLAPLASRVIVCADGVVTQSVTHTLTVAAEVFIQNQASAFAPEDPAGPVHSNGVQSVVALSGSARVGVQVSEPSPTYTLYLPIMTKDVAPVRPRPVLRR